MRRNFLLLSKTFLQLFLFGLFLAFFGIPSLNQYQRKEIIVLKSESKINNGIVPPAVTILAKRNSLGWKTVEKDQFWQSFDLVDHCMGINMTVDDCMKEDSFELADFLKEVKYIGVNRNYTAPILLDSSSPLLWKEDMSLAGYGRHFTFLSLKNVTQNEEDCLAFIMARNFSFDVFVHDEDFFLYSVNPLGPPSNFWQIENSSKNHYQEVTLTMHKKLNLDRQQCEEDPDYRFSNCIRESLSKKVKCIELNSQLNAPFSVKRRSRSDVGRAPAVGHLVACSPRSAVSVEALLFLRVLLSKHDTRRTRYPNVTLTIDFTDVTLVIEDIY